MNPEYQKNNYINPEFM